MHKHKVQPVKNTRECEEEKKQKKQRVIGRRALFPPKPPQKEKEKKLNCANHAGYLEEIRQERWRALAVSRAGVGELGWLGELASG